MIFGRSVMCVIIIKVNYYRGYACRDLNVTSVIFSISTQADSHLQKQGKYYSTTDLTFIK